MIALRAVRLVGWHYFDDVTIPIGERTLFVGDNGSGKSTIVDAIQYAMAANLSRLRFNAAAAERRTGRTLEGYVRGKTGLESGEYLRGDAVAHVMLEFGTPTGCFAAGICVEAFKDEVQQREYPWIGDGISIAALPVRDAEAAVLPGRRFRDTVRAMGASTYESKRDYNDQLTFKLGVHRRNVEFNPYLDALLRSVSFTPLTSIDAFVCDYILEDRPVDISLMKENLASYKEAEREADDTVRKIEALGRVSSLGEEWRSTGRAIELQEYLRLRVDTERAKESVQRHGARVRELSREIESREHASERLAADLLTRESLRRDLETALARDDSFLLLRSLREKKAVVDLALEKARQKQSRWEILRSQCATLLKKPLGSKKEDPDVEAEIDRCEAEKEALTRADVAAGIASDATERLLADASSELAGLEGGTTRYPPESSRLRDELQRRGIQAWIFADLVEVRDESWQNALEGWLNTQRFSVLVEPEKFKDALALYDTLPREIAGVHLPNLGRMRQARAGSASLASLVETESPYARIYADYLLGQVMCATLDTLRDNDRAVTKECMSYSSHSATRMRQEVYARWYLGAGARRRRMEILRVEIQRLMEEKRACARETATRRETIENLRRALSGLRDMLALDEERKTISTLVEQSGELTRQIGGVDTSGIHDLESRIRAVAAEIAEVAGRRANEIEALGKARGYLESTEKYLKQAEEARAESDRRFAQFLEGKDAMLGEFDSYYRDRAGASSLADLASNYDSSMKGLRTRLDRCADAYRKATVEYNGRFNSLLPLEPSEAAEIDSIMKRYVDSELPVYREKISRARADAERQFKEHFVARLNEYIEEARESFREINETLREISFGRDQYRFTLEERAEKRGQLDVIRKAAGIAELETGLFAQLADPAERKAVELLFEKILRNDLDSSELRNICDYRTYFAYDIRMRDLTAIDPKTGKPSELSLSRVLREKSGGETQTPYYVAIAASFYRFYKDKPKDRVRLVLFDEAFNRMDDERIGRALELFRRLGMQIVTAVPTEKLELIAPWMDTICLVVRHGYRAVVRDFRAVVPDGAAGTAKSSAGDAVS